VDHPRREVLAEGYSAELGMLAGPVKILCCQAQSCKSSKTFGTELAKVIQQLWKALAPRGLKLGEAIEAGERNRFSVSQDMFHARHPIRPLSVNQVPDYVIGAPRSRAFRARYPV
jgi:hypothetical protein